MISFLAPLLLRLGIPERFAKAATITALVVLAVIGLGIAKCSYDRKLIAEHDANQRADVATGARTADRTADTAAATRDAERVAQSHALQGAIDNASQTQPDAVRRPAGPATNALLDELRRQQRAAGDR